MIRTYHIDCMEFMKSVPGGTYDLAIVDPPYGINATSMKMGTNTARKGDGYPAESTADRLKRGRLNSGGGTLKNRTLNTSNCHWDYAPPGREYFQELFRVSREQIIFGGNYFDLPPTRCIVCWDKLQPWENFSQFELAWTSFDRPAAIFRYSNTGGANKERKIHQTQKPVALYKWLMTKFSRPGGLLLDTHGGSFSSAIAAHELGFSMDICELDADYFASGNERLQRHIRQLMFPAIQEADYD